MPRTLLVTPNDLLCLKSNLPFHSTEKNVKSRTVWIHCKNLGTILIKDRSYWWSQPENHLYPSLLNTNIKNPENPMMMLICKLQVSSCICQWVGPTKKKNWREIKKQNKTQQLIKYITWSLAKTKPSLFSITLSFNSLAYWSRLSPLVKSQVRQSQGVVVIYFLIW